MLSTEIFIIQHIFVYFCLIMTLLGLLGNLLVFIIYGFDEMKKFSISLYFQVASLVNSLMVFHMLRETLAIEYDWSITLFSDFVCKITDFSEHTLGAIEAWILVCISLDRFINIKFNNRYSLLSSRKFQASLMTTVVIFNVLFYSLMIWNSELKNIFNTSNSTFNSSFESNVTLYFCENSADRVIYWMDLFNSVVIPFIFMIVINALMISHIKKSRKRIHQVSSHNKKTLLMDRKFAILAITYNFLFLVLNLPNMVFLLVSVYVNIEPELNTFLYYITATIYYNLFAIEFFVQFVANSLFRAQAITLFKLFISYLKI
jgi:hypothetical protein